MGILTEEEIKKIDDQIRDNYSGINLLPVMKDNTNKVVILDKVSEVAYFLVDSDFEQCYRKQSLVDFKKSIDTLKEEGWIIL